MFGATLVDTEEGTVSLEAHGLEGRTRHRLRRLSLKVKCDMIIRASAQGEVKDGRDCIMQKTSPGTGVSLSLLPL